MTFPENCLKGIPNKDFVTDDGKPRSHLFYFDRSESNLIWKGQSINWQDDEYAVELTLAQKKEDGSLQFKGGIVVLPRAEVDHLRNLPFISGMLSYERQRLENNAYHGNLLLKDNVPIHQMKAVAACLAMAGEHIIPQSS